MTYLGSPLHKENLAKGRLKAANTFKQCTHCGVDAAISGLKNHEKNCYLNPLNKKDCIRCGKPIKNFRDNLTCSKSCSNIHWPRAETTSHRGICFKFHERKCCVCDERNIVEVHHLDKNNKNNNPNNLVPLCPTHHQYWHSKFKHLVERQVLDYMEKWSAIQDLNLGSPDSKSGRDDQTPLMAD